MTLNLSRFQARRPYPAPRHIHPDRELAVRLMEGYSGEYSELTTTLQYAYHSLLCKEGFEELSLTMRGIFYVETLHMELLGDCINRLGGEPLYLLTLRENMVPWQAAVVQYEYTPEKMLLADIKGEKGAAAFYEELAAGVEQADIARLMARLAEDERLHARMLTELHQKYFHS